MLKPIKLKKLTEGTEIIVKEISLTEDNSCSFSKKGKEYSIFFGERILSLRSVKSIAFADGPRDIEFIKKGEMIINGKDKNSERYFSATIHNIKLYYTIQRRQLDDYIQKIRKESMKERIRQYFRDKEYRDAEWLMKHPTYCDERARITERDWIELLLEHAENLEKASRNEEALFIHKRYLKRFERGKMERWMRVRERITQLRKEIEKLSSEQSTLVDRQAKLETEILGLVAADPANLTLKIEELQKQFSELKHEDIKKYLSSIGKELGNADKQIELLQGTITDNKRMIENLQSQLATVKNQLEKMENEDPANVKVQLELLEKKWSKLTKPELETLESHGQVATLFKEQLLKKETIRETKSKIASLERQIGDIRQRSCLLQLKKLSLKQEELKRSISPRLTEAERELTKLEAELIAVKKRLGKERRARAF